MMPLYRFFRRRIGFNAVTEASTPIPVGDTSAMTQDSTSSLWVRVVWSPTTWSTTILLVLVAIFGIARPDAFLTAYNLKSIAVDAVPILIMGVGVTYVLSVGGIDLSVGNVLICTSVVAVRAMVLVGGDGLVTCLVGLAAAVLAGIAFGMLNGVLIAYAKIPALVVTIGIGFVAQGLAYVWSGGQDLRGVPVTLVENVGFAQFLGIPDLIWIAAIIAVIGTLVYTTTRFGRHTYALGSSQEAAIRAGIRVKRHLLIIYTLSGVTAGFVGYLSLAQFGTTTIAGHATDFLYVLLAVILGGTSLFGGIGTVAGTCLASFIPWTLSDGFVILNIDPYWQYVTLGGVFVVVVYFDVLRRRVREGVRA